MLPKIGKLIILARAAKSKSLQFCLKYYLFWCICYQGNVALFHTSIKFKVFLKTHYDLFPKVGNESIKAILFFVLKELALY